MKSIEIKSANLDISLRSAAIIAGVGLLLMAIVAPYANFAVLEHLVVPGDATMTTNNIKSSLNLFRVGIACFLFVIVLDILVAWALYVLFIPVNKSVSLLTGWLRLVYSVIFALALTNFISVLHVVTDVEYGKVVAENEVQVQVMYFIQSFTYTWNIGLFFFGLHLLLLGYLTFVSGFIPKWLGVLLVIAGIGYAIDGIGKILIPGYAVTVTMVTFIGEVVLIFWLLIWGRKIQS